MEEGEEIEAYPSWGAAALGQILTWGEEVGEEGEVSHPCCHDHRIWRSAKGTGKVSLLIVERRDKPANHIQAATET